MAEQLVFVTIEWDGPKRREADPFGPWTVREDGSHLAEIQDFLKRWRDTEAKPGMTVVMWLPTSPDAYEQRAAST
ncbi:hypothetical protein [Nonomuraea sp. NPDC049750]|uniref:hypothetical protein n=1 Tax=Nonomuraea sp. NPDC049750 TaxID=3154738 RepID=UPI0033E47D4B